MLVHLNMYKKKKDVKQKVSLPLDSENTSKTTVLLWCRCKLFYTKYPTRSVPNELFPEQRNWGSLWFCDLLPIEYKPSCKTPGFLSLPLYSSSLCLCPCLLFNNIAGVASSLPSSPLLSLLTRRPSGLTPPSYGHRDLSAPPCRTVTSVYVLTFIFLSSFHLSVSLCQWWVLFFPLNSVGNCKWIWGVLEETWET